MIRASGLYQRFGAQVALDGVDLAVSAGEAVAIIGPSGAGKTTLFRVLNLTLAPERGTLLVAGVDVGGLDEPGRRALRRRIGSVYQQHNLVGRLPVVHNVLAGALGRMGRLEALRRLVWPGDVSEVRDALAAVGIAEKLTARTDRLSGGEQQRVAVARLLVQDPELILADEPVSSVDPRLATSIVTLLLATADRRRKTLLVSLHSVELALKYFPRVIGMRAGRIAFDLPPAAVSQPMLEALYAGESPALEPPPAIAEEQGRLHDVPVRPMV